MIYSDRRLVATLFFLGTVSVVAPFRSVSAASSAQDVYKEAQLQESTARNPDEAIRLYEEFLKQPGTDRTTQAGAYLHVGLCESRLGRNDAAKTAWKKVVQDYSDQSDSYAEALNQLQKIQVSVKRI